MPYTPWYTTPEALTILASIKRRPARRYDRDDLSLSRPEPRWEYRLAKGGKIDELFTCWIKSPAETKTAWVGVGAVIGAIFGHPAGEGERNDPFGWDASAEWADIRQNVYDAAREQGYLDLALRVLRRQRTVCKRSGNA